MLQLLAPVRDAEYRYVRTFRVEVSRRLRAVENRDPYRRLGDNRIERRSHPLDPLLEGAVAGGVVDQHGRRPDQMRCDRPQLPADVPVGVLAVVNEQREALDPRQQAWQQAPARAAVEGPGRAEVVGD